MAPVPSVSHGGAGRPLLQKEALKAAAERAAAPKADGEGRLLQGEAAARSTSGALETPHEAGWHASAWTAILHGRLGEARAAAAEAIGPIAAAVRSYAARYPPLAAFLYMLLLLGAIPTSAFAIFAIASSLSLLAAFLVGFALIQGLILAVSGTILLAALGSIFLLTALSFGAASFAYLCLVGARRSAGLLYGAMTITEEDVPSASLPIS